jgi:peptide-methionine (R)-S-oxide reductase
MNSMRYIVLFVVFGVLGCQVKGQKPEEAPKQVAVHEQLASDTAKVIEKSDKEWKGILTPRQYQVLRLKDTDRPFTGKYYLHHEKGTYVCAGCGTELFTSDMKFDSNCGWPSFDREIAGGKIKTVTDNSFGMTRIEILCARCGGHLGHLFDDGPTLTGQRYCVNSTSIDFKAAEGEKKPKK